MLVMKFGGTSVGTAEQIRRACSIVQKRLARRPFVVVSAHNSPDCRMTDTLIQSAKDALEGRPDPARVIQLQRGVCHDLGLDTALVDPLLQRFTELLHGIDMIGEISPRTMDLVMSFGERMSSRVFATVLQNEFGLRTTHMDSFDLGLLTDGNFGAAEPDPACFPLIRERVESFGTDVTVTTGFLGKGPDGHITTLGRSGSDYSATIFGAALEAEEVEIWTDVDGVMSADPKSVPASRSIPELSFSEAAELAWYGARVLHPATMIPAMQHNIPVRVLNTGRPDSQGTVIRSVSELPYDGIVKSIAHKSHISMMTITSSRMLGMHGFMAKVFEICSKHRIDIHMIATSEVSISLTTPKGAHIEAAAEELRAYGDVEIEHEKALLCVVGEKMAGTPGVAARVTTALAEANVNIRMISQGACELNIALLVEHADVMPAVQAIHGTFFGNGTNP